MWPESKPSWASSIGTAAHLAIELGSIESARQSLELTARQKDIVSAIYTQYDGWLSLNGWAIKPKKEVAMYYNPADGSAGYIDGKFHRDYSSAPAGSFCMTVDLMYESGPYDFLDIKTGWLAKPPQELPQFKLIALTLSVLLGKDEISCGTLALREGYRNLFPARFSGFTLGLTKEEAGRAHLAIASGAGPNPSPENCKYCPIRNECEASLCKKMTKARSKS